MKKHLGWIALDIDGTITDATHHAPQEVIDYLHRLSEKGWELVFITGRTFSFAYSVLKNFDFEFYLAVQNGADILHLPKRELVSRHYLDPRTISVLDEVYHNCEEDFIIYAGYERGDFCYYRPERFSQRLLNHLQIIMSFSPEPWQSVERFVFPPDLLFPLVKCLGTKEAMEQVSAAVQGIPEVCATMIKDPLAESIYLNLITSTHATKGKALRAIQSITQKGGPVIAAGDDLNDISMLMEADVKIVMSTAPRSMHAFANLIAKPGSECGIINALEEATRNV